MRSHFFQIACHYQSSAVGSFFFFSFNQAVCIENSCMVRGSKEGRNGIIHLFREIIKPAEKSLHETLKNDKRFR